MFCKCRDCKGMKRKGFVLGAQLLRHLGSGAYHVSAYVPYHKWQPGRKKVGRSTGRRLALKQAME